MKRLLIGGIRFYQKHISPATPPSCRYHPTCSTYALQAVEKHGALKGGVMGAARIIRCNPFVAGGVDEVPDYFTIFRNPDNVDDEYIPEYLMPIDHGAMAELKELRAQYEDELKVFENLPSSLEVLGQIADVQELTREDLEIEFSADEMNYLEEVDIFPGFEREDVKYFKLSATEKNKRYLNTVENFDEGLEFGADFPMIVLEKTGIWYTNAPRLLDRFLIERGVTDADLQNNSYHLWLVLKAIQAENK